MTDRTKLRSPFNQNTRQYGALSPDREPPASEFADEGSTLRHIVAINDAAANERRRFPSNSIKTAKYRVVTFLPLNLFEQFHRASNIFFLITGCVALIPHLSPISPVTTIAPLVFVLMVAAAKDAIEDYARHKADKQANSAKYQVTRVEAGLETAAVTMASAEIKTGDLVYLERGQHIPADLIVLATSEEDGVCYVETSNLDGESNLKRRQTPRVTASMRAAADVEVLRGEVACQEPNEKLYEFEGTLRLRDQGMQSAHPLTANNILLRGARLRNTKWVVGMVVYAGVDSKLFKNLQQAPAKVSSVQKQLNKVVLIIFVLYLIWVLTCSVAAALWQSGASSYAYLEDVVNMTPQIVFGTSLVTYFILYTYLIPISLFVTMELVRVGQAWFMEWDVNMKGQTTEGTEASMKVRNSNMNEELGRVQHVFSDKTGTLTRNVMDLALWFIHGTRYDHRNQRENLQNARRGIKGSPGDTVQPKVARRPQSAPELPTGQVITQFLRVIALCNSVVPDVQPDGSVNYDAQSPDEVALVTAARELGVELASRVGSVVTVKVDGNAETYEVLNLLEFSSNRKRMSIIVKYPDGSIHIHTKGADTAVLPLLEGDDSLTTITEKHMSDAASEGLRTLTIATSKLAPHEYESWRNLYADAEVASADRVRRVEAACEKIERRLKLLGATAVEDKLQDQVPETIEFLLNAGVAVWVLTGDKRETAENIGYATGLFTRDATLIRCVNTNSLRDTENEMSRCLAQAQLGSPENQALVIDGVSLNNALSMPDRFLELADNCQAVLCCRVTPIQKARIVEMFAENRNTVSLAVGDGANDVSMIQAASVGVGIIGNEGTQAVRASDYAISEFRHLRQLLAVHGRYSLVRITLLIEYSFYRSLMWIVPQFIFTFFTGFSGQVIYDQLILATYNIFWVSLPPLVMGIWEKDVPESLLHRFPGLYAALKHEQLFNTRSVATWLILGIYHGMVVFFVGTYGAGWFGTAYSNGRVSSLWEMAAVLASIAIVVALVKAALVIRHWNVFSILAVWGSMALYFGALIVYSVLPISDFNSDIYDIPFEIFGTVNFYLFLGLTLGLALIPDYAYEYLQTMYFPTQRQLVLEHHRRQRKSARNINADLPAEGSASPSPITSPRQRVDRQPKAPVRPVSATARPEMGAYSIGEEGSVIRR